MNRIIIICAALCMATMGCQNQQASQNSEQNKPQAAAPSAQTAPKADSDALTEEKAKAYQEKFKREKQFLPPRPDVVFTVSNTNDKISTVDAERSYLYQQSGVKRCYMNALADDLNLKGDAVFSLQKSDAGEIQVMSYEDTLNHAGFTTCIKESLNRWRLPAGALLSAKISFSARPAPTLDELKKANEGTKEDHEH